MNNLLNKIFSQISKFITSMSILVILSLGFSFVNAAEDGFPPGRAAADGGHGGGIVGESNANPLATQARSIAIGTEAEAVCPLCETPVNLGASTTPTSVLKVPTNGTQGGKTGN